MPLLAVTWSGPEHSERARCIAEDLHLPLAGPADGTWPHLLVVDSGALRITSTGKGAPGPILVDFAAARLSRRYRGGGELLTRACGIKSGKRPGILDATAGLGTDAFLLAYHGSALELCERDPLVAALLADGIRRGEQAEQAGVSEAVARMSLRQTDAVTLLESRSPQSVDVVYLDPMFPRDRRSAKAKKEMNLLQTLLPESIPSPGLLPAALRAAAGRVVVKRGIKAAALDDRAPAFTLKGRSVRFDVYLGGSAPQ